MAQTNSLDGALTEQRPLLVNPALFPGQGKKRSWCARAFWFDPRDQLTHRFAYPFAKGLGLLYYLASEIAFALGLTGMISLLYFFVKCHLHESCMDDDQDLLLKQFYIVGPLLLLSMPIGYRRFTIARELIQFESALYQDLLQLELPRLLQNRADGAHSDASGVGHSDARITVSETPSAQPVLDFMNQLILARTTKKRLPFLLSCGLSMAPSGVRQYHLFLHVLFYVIPYNFFLNYLLQLAYDIFRDDVTHERNDPEDLTVLSWICVGLATVGSVIFRINYDYLALSERGSLNAIDHKLLNFIALRPDLVGPKLSEFKALMLQQGQSACCSKKAEHELPLTHHYLKTLSQ